MLLLPKHFHSKKMENMRVTIWDCISDLKVAALVCLIEREGAGVRGDMASENLIHF